MKIEQFRQRAGVTEKYVLGAGATVSSRIIASVCTALVAPAPGISDIQKVSVADTGPIRAGYERDRMLIQFVSGNYLRSIAKNL